MILIDTSVWVEIASGTSKGAMAKERMNASVAAYCCILSISELVVWAQKNGVDPIVVLNLVSQASAYLDLNPDILRQAGLNYVEFRKTKSKIGLIDSIIYTTARMHGLELLTCDRDFEGLPGVEMF